MHGYATSSVLRRQIARTCMVRLQAVAMEAKSGALDSGARRTHQTHRNVRRISWDVVKSPILPLFSAADNVTRDYGSDEVHAGVLGAFSVGWHRAYLPTRLPCFTLKLPPSLTTAFALPSQATPPTRPLHAHTSASRHRLDCTPTRSIAPARLFDPCSTAISALCASLARQISPDTPRLSSWARCTFPHSRPRHTQTQWVLLSPR
jgi:hypothetical protein